MSSSASQTGKELYEFGPFRVDVQREILLRAGEPVPLKPKTFHILLVLVRHSQEVVTKDDLMKAVWPDTFVEEANLSRNIFMLRKALGESPQDRRYVVTVPGRGYRLVDSVRLVPERELSIVAANHSKVQVQVKETKPSARPWVLIAAVVGLLLAVAAVALRFSLQGRTVLSEKDTLVLADFANATGDPVFEGTLRQGLAVQLEQSPFLSLISEERTQRTLQLMGQPADARLTPEIAREVCERTASAAVLDGSIASLGGQYVLGLRAKDCRTGDVLAEEQVQAAKKENVLNALDQIASKLRARLGESLTTVRKHNAPLAEATTPSLEALKTYSAGWRILSSTGSAAAVPFFQHAIEIDPTFAMAYAALGRMYGDIGESILSAENTSKAYQLRHRVSDYEKFFISASYDLQVTGNVKKAEQTCELWAQAYPRAMIPHAFLSGAIYPALGKYERSVEEAKTAAELDPDFPIAYFILSSSDLALERMDEAENTLQRAFQRNLQSPELAVQQYVVDFWRDDKKKMEQDTAEAQGKSRLDDLISNSEALARAYSGHLAEARRLSKRASDLAQKADHPGMAALYEMQAALREGLFENELAAKQRAVAALRLSKNRDVEFGAAFALALSGDYSRSQALTNDLVDRFPEDTTVRFSYAPTLWAVLALKHSEPLRAIELLQTAIPYEFGIAPGILYDSGNFYAVYVRGESYLATHQNREAAGEFQKIVDHRGIVLSDPIGALAHLDLGRAYAIGGDTAKAKGAYQDFLTLWKDADADIPILKRAKAEYAKLQ
jgi:DNA-binding winged helix-turn-helix (wHTH) protein/tetratricopeptide (TPR) repeat protein